MTADAIAGLGGAAARYRDAQPAGRLLAFPVTAIDRLGIPTWSVTFDADDGTTGGGHGYGETDEEALTGALGELSEVTHGAAAFRRRVERRRASYRSLVTEVGSGGATDPLTLGLPAGSEVDEHTELEWVPARRWTTGETVWVPTDVAASLGEDLAGYRPFTTPITNGLGAGDTLARAVGHGLLELAQRDGNGLAFRALDRGIELDVSTASSENRALLDRLMAAGVEAVPKLAAVGDDAFGLANVYVVGRDLADDGDPLMATACGEAADTDRDRALRKAILEFAAARARKAFTHGPLGLVEAVTPAGYLDDYVQRHREDPEEARALDAMVAWLDLDNGEMTALLRDSVFGRRTTVPFDELPSSAATPVAARTDAVLLALAAQGLDVLWLDLSPVGADDLGVHVVKAIVPGMEVETMSYHRIGERGAARLLAQDSRLVGRGRPPRSGTAPIRLTAAATARLGGPLWLDVAEIDRIVGRLYPLYREPGRHRAALGQPDPLMRLELAYNTNGLAHHRLEDAVGLVADVGYDGIALTLDHHHLDPFGPALPARTAHVQRLLARAGLRVVVETGARFLLDPRAKHEPTFVTADATGRARRLAFLRLAADVAADLGAEALSCWAGVPAPGVDRVAAWSWLVDGLGELLDHARRVGVTVAVEPEPGMLVETPADWARLRADVGSPRLRMALDVGHCLVAGDEEPADAVVAHAADLGTVSIDDMHRGVHEHLPFGDGDLDLVGVLAALHRIGWSGLTCVELSRDSHRADRLVPATIAALRTAESSALAELVG